MKKRMTIKHLVVSFLIGAAIPVWFESTLLAQAQNAEDAIQNEQESSESVSSTNIGTSRGLDELRILMESSEPTNAPPVRRIFITPTEGTPEGIQAQQAATAAIREFFLIADSNSFDTDAIIALAPDLEGPSGVAAGLENGGTIRIKIRNANAVTSGNSSQKPSAELRLRGHGIAGYERVNQIEFVIR